MTTDRITKFSICVALMALSAATPAVYAQDKGKSDFTHSAEFRVRDTFEQNESGNSSMQPSHHNGVDQRFKLNLGFKANEKFSFAGTFIQSASWGQSAYEPLGDRNTLTTNGQNPNTADQTNFLAVNEAYANWMMTEMLGVKIGRQNFAFGDGSVMSVNDWQRQPLAFDGVTAQYEMEFARFHAFAFKYRDFSGPMGNNFVNTALTSDPQHDAYGLVFDLKTMPEWLKMVNAYIIEDTADGVPTVNNGTTPPTNGPSTGNTVQGNQAQNALRYGALASATFAMVDLKAGYNMVTGKNTDFAGLTATPTASRTISESMLQAELGLNFQGFMMSRLYVSYHQDSGASATDTDSKTYDPYMYDRHNGSGLMELVGWGNLTDIAIGWTAKPTDATDVGLSYNMFSKTQQTGTTNSGYYGTNLFNFSCGGSGQPACHSSLGNEIDLWAEHRYEGGLSMLARVGYFMPGDQLKDSVINRSASITQLMVQGRFAF